MKTKSKNLKTCTYYWRVALFLFALAPLANGSLSWSQNGVTEHANAPFLDFNGVQGIPNTTLDGVLCNAETTYLCANESVHFLFVNFEQSTLDRAIDSVLAILSDQAAIILGSSDIIEGRGRYLYDVNPSGMTTIPIYEVNEKAAKELKSLLESVSRIDVTLTTGDVNPWQQLAESPWSVLLQILLLLPPCGCFAFVGIVAYTHFQYHDKNVIIPRIVIGLHLFALLSIIVMSTDYQIRNLLPGTMILIMLDMSVAPTVIATLLVTLAWQDALTARNLEVKEFLSKRLRIVFICIAVFLGTVYVLSVFSRIFIDGGYFGYVAGALAVLIVIGMLVFKFTTAYSIGKQLYAFQKETDSGSHKFLNRLRWRMVLVGVSYFTYIIGLVVIISGVVGTPIGFFCVGLLIFPSVSMVAVAQVQTFYQHSKSIKSASSSKVRPNSTSASTIKLAAIQSVPNINGVGNSSFLKETDSDDGNEEEGSQSNKSTSDCESTTSAKMENIRTKTRVQKVNSTIEL